VAADQGRPQRLVAAIGVTGREVSSVEPVQCGDMRVDLLDRITVDPAVCGGLPCVKSHRIWVSLVLAMLADGASSADVLAEYPSLESDDVLACIAYGATLAGGHFVDVG